MQRHLMSLWRASGDEVDLGADASSKHCWSGVLV
jgi:hypothetical protein